MPFERASKFSGPPSFFFLLSFLKVDALEKRRRAIPPRPALVPRIGGSGAVTSLPFSHFLATITANEDTLEDCRRLSIFF